MGIREIGYSAEIKLKTLKKHKRSQQQNWKGEENMQVL